MRGKIGLFGMLTVASFLLAGCTGPATFTVDGTWQFASSQPNPDFGMSCNYPPGAITVSNDHGKVLGKGEVTTTDFGMVDGYSVCNVQFLVKDVPESAQKFIFSVPGYDDSKLYTRDEASLVQIDSP
jgi:hypothetical protein